MTLLSDPMRNIPSSAETATSSPAMSDASSGASSMQEDNRVLCVDLDTGRFVVEDAVERQTEDMLSSRHPDREALLEKGIRMRDAKRAKRRAKYKEKKDAMWAATSNAIRNKGRKVDDEDEPVLPRVLNKSKVSPTQNRIAAELLLYRLNKEEARVINYKTSKTEFKVPCYADIALTTGANMETFRRWTDKATYRKSVGSVDASSPEFHYRYLQWQRQQLQTFSKTPPNSGPPDKLSETQKTRLKRFVLANEWNNNNIDFADYNRFILDMLRRENPEKVKENQTEMSPEWWDNFLLATPELDITSRAYLEHARMRATCDYTLMDYQAKLQAIFYLHDIGLLINMDETGIDGDETKDKKSKKKELGERGQGVKYRVTHMWREHFTCTAAVTWDGEFLEPFFVWSHKMDKGEIREPSAQHASRAFQDSGRDDVPADHYMRHMVCTSSGNMNRKAFGKWSREVLFPFVKKKNPENSFHTLLLLDGHVSHMIMDDEALYEQFKELRIITLCLPSHTTHVLQVR